MTRNYGRIKTSIWTDDDFRELSDSAQALYLRLLSAPSMNLCGVCDWRPKKIAVLTRGMTTEGVERAAAELVEGRYIVLDEATDEVLVRTFVRHESVIHNPKTAAGAQAAFRGIVSRRLRSAVAYEMRRLQRQEQELKGWEMVSEVLQFATDWVPDWVSDADSIAYQTRTAWVSEPPSRGPSDPVSIPREPRTENREPESENLIPAAGPVVDRPDVDELCTLLADRIEGNGSKRPTVNQGWRDACRLMLDRDQIPADSIRGAIEWSQANEFWRANILSFPKLRAKYDQLRLAAIAEQQKRAKRSRQQDTDDIFAGAYERARQQEQETA